MRNINIHAHGYALTIFITLAVQFLLLSISFPITEILTETPLFRTDAAHHWYEIKVAVDLARHGHLVGYDPFFAAGYLGGIPYNTSARFPAALAVLFSSWMSPAIAFKLFSFSCAVITPVFLPLGARKLGMSVQCCAMVALLSLLLWWDSPVRWSHANGIVAWPFAVFAAFWFTVNLMCYALGRTGELPLFVTTLLGAVLFLIHPLFPVAVVFAAFPLLLSFAQSMLWRRVAVILVVVPVVFAAINFPWIIEMARHPGMANGMQPYQRSVDINRVWQDMLGLNNTDLSSKFYFVIFFLACWGVSAGRGFEKKLASTFALGWLLTIVFTDIGAANDTLGVMAPNRFGVQAYSLLIMPAAIGVIAIWNGLHAVGIKQKFAMGGAVFAALALVFFLNEVRRELTPGPHGHYGVAPPEVAGIGPVSRWAIEQLQGQTDSSARVLFELSLARIYDGSNNAGFIAVQSDREFIGGAYPYTHFANVQDHSMFSHPLETLKPHQFREYLDLYNIGWLLLHSDEAKRYVSTFPEISLVSKNQLLDLYRVEREHSFFLTGSGVVKSRAINRLELADLQGETVTLKYHYLPGMLSDLPVMLDGVKMLDDPEPFIRIQHPPKSLRLYMAD